MRVLRATVRAASHPRGVVLGRCVKCGLSAPWHGFCDSSLCGSMSMLREWPGEVSIAPPQATMDWTTGAHAALPWTVASAWPSEGRVVSQGVLL